MSLKAYQNTQTANESPRQTEYRLFAAVTRALIEVKDCAPTDAALHNALDWNRQVWSVLSTDCGAAGNQLPDALRAGIVSLAIFVGKYTSQVARGNDDIETLIDINRTIMEGLTGAAENQPAPPPTTAPPGVGKTDIKS